MTTTTREELAQAAGRQGWLREPDDRFNEIEHYARGDARIEVHYTAAGSVNFAMVRNAGGELVENVGTRDRDRADRVTAAFGREDLGQVPALGACQGAADAFGWARVSHPSAGYAIWQLGSLDVDVAFAEHGVAVHFATLSLSAADPQPRRRVVDETGDEELGGGDLGTVLAWLADERPIP